MPSALEVHSLIQFLNDSPTPFHAIEQCRQILKKAHFIELEETHPWVLTAGQGYFVVRGDASLFAFRIPQHFSTSGNLHVIGAHTDSPGLRLKPNPSAFREGYHLLNVEIYGSPILQSWLDRDLSFGGLLVFRQRSNRELNTRLIRSDCVVRIPNLAIHLDDPANPVRLNPQTHLMPILGLGGADISLNQYLESLLNPGEELVDWDLHFFDTQQAAHCGFHREFVSSSRLDNLAMVHAALRAITETQASERHIQAVLLFHNEEIGSLSWQGAQSSFAPQILDRLFSALQVPRDLGYSILHRSLLISADMAHAIHPAHEDRHDPQHKPRINQGPVIKINAARRYATEALTAAKFREICRMANVPVQNFCARNDQRCGSTIGPSLTALLGIPAVDVGNPMLAMHSIREIAGTEDHDHMIRALKFFLAQE